MAADALDNCHTLQREQTNIDQAFGDLERACDTDDDGDGFDDRFDNCQAAQIPTRPIWTKMVSVICDPDRDGDGIDNQFDNCPAVPNPAQANVICVTMAGMLAILCKPACTDCAAIFDPPSRL